MGMDIRLTERGLKTAHALLRQRPHTKTVWVYSETWGEEIPEDREDGQELVLPVLDGAVCFDTATGGHNLLGYALAGWVAERLAAMGIDYDVSV